MNALYVDLAFGGKKEVKKMCREKDVEENKRKMGENIAYVEKMFYLCTRNRKDGGIAQLVRAHDS